MADGSHGAGLPASGVQDMVSCTQCGGPFAAAETIVIAGQHVCAACRTILLQRVTEGATLVGGPALAGFWLRFLASMLDGFLLLAVNLLLGFAVMPWFGVEPGTPGNPFGNLAAQSVLSLLQMAVSATYETWFIGKMGATPGKLAARVRVTRGDGSPLTYGRALGRYFAKLLSWFTCGIGFVIAASDDQKRALHDRIVDSRVVRLDGAMALGPPGTAPAAACAGCRSVLPQAVLGRDRSDACPACRRDVRVLAFPALLRPIAPSSLPERAVLADESTCYTHQESRAIVVCNGCGRFLCGLCDLEVDGRRLCPACLEGGRRTGKLGLDRERLLWDHIAFSLAVLPVLLSCAIVVTAPAALVLVLWKRTEPGSLVHRAWPRFFLAGVIAALEIAMMVLGLGAVVLSR